MRGEHSNFDITTEINEHPLKNLEEARAVSAREHPSFKGREIRGLESREVSFSLLEEGMDYEMKGVNENVISEGAKPQDFFVFVNPTGGDKRLVVNAPHWRTITFPERIRAKINDGEGLGSKKEEPYYAVNVKGVGYLKPFLKGKNLDDYQTWLEFGTDNDPKKIRTNGFAWQLEFSRPPLIQLSQSLIASGLRTELYWATARVKKVYYKGVLTEVGDLKKRFVVGYDPENGKNFVPYIGVRLLKTNDRIEEVYAADEVRSKKIFADAFRVFNLEAKDKGLEFPELIFENSEHQMIFFKEFFRRMGGNLAALLNTGNTHMHLHPANITLAAEVADIGTVLHWRDYKERLDINKKYGKVRRCHLKDMRDICFDLKRLLAAGRALGLAAGNLAALRTAFFSGFDLVFDQKHAKKEETDFVNARKWLEEIFRRLIIENDNLKSLGNDQNFDAIEKEWRINI